MHLPHRVRRLAAAVLLIAGSMTQSALAQGLDQFAGQWGCKYSVEPFNGNAAGKHYWEFGMVLQPNGAYQMQGIYYNPIVGQMPIQGSGGWEVAQTGVVHVKGQILRQDAGWVPFEFIAQPISERSLLLNFKGNTAFTRIVCDR